MCVLIINNVLKETKQGDAQEGDYLNFDNKV